VKHLLPFTLHCCVIRWRLAIHTFSTGEISAEKKYQLKVLFNYKNYILLGWQGYNQQRVCGDPFMGEVPNSSSGLLPPRRQRYRAHKVKEPLVMGDHPSHLDPHLQQWMLPSSEFVYT
jgi:hypothetical protein